MRKTNIMINLLVVLCEFIIHHSGLELHEINKLKLTLS